MRTDTDGEKDSLNIFTVHIFSTIAIPHYRNIQPTLLYDVDDIPVSHTKKIICLSLYNQENDSIHTYLTTSKKSLSASISACQQKKNLYLSPSTSEKRIYISLPLPEKKETISLSLYQQKINFSLSLYQQKKNLYLSPSTSKKRIYISLPLPAKN
jgi:hypothetical protein